MAAINYSEVNFAAVKLHQLRTSLGKVKMAFPDHSWLPLARCDTNSTDLLQVFILAEVAIEVFQDNPTVFLQVSTGAAWPSWV